MAVGIQLGIFDTQRFERRSHEAASVREQAVKRALGREAFAIVQSNDERPGELFEAAARCLIDCLDTVEEMRALSPQILLALVRA